MEPGTGARVTLDGQGFCATWSPDGKRIIYESRRPPKWTIYWRGIENLQAEAEELYSSQQLIALQTCTPDGTKLIVRQMPGTFWMLSLDGSRKVEPLYETKFNATFIRFSPDGRWFSWTEDESGRSEVYVQRYPKGNRIQISFEGGEEAIWSAKGDELFYRNRDTWMAVSVSLDPTFKAGKQRLLFQGPFINVPDFSYDVLPDGQRFLMLMPEHPDTPVTQLHVVLNWFDELKRRVPVTTTKSK
ncbi:MAG TPA: hypothetical protein VGK40_09030 [Verrucomicrobiae bacterium]